MPGKRRPLQLSGTFSLNALSDSDAHAIQREHSPGSTLILAAVLPNLRNLAKFGIRSLARKFASLCLSNHGQRQKCNNMVQHVSTALHPNPDQNCIRRFLCCRTVRIIVTTTCADTLAGWAVCCKHQLTLPATRKEDPRRAS